MRYLRLVLGLAIIIGALYIIVTEQMAGASSDAVANAPVITLRTPIAGTLDLLPFALGAAVEQGEPVAAVEDTQVDNVRLNDLLLERDLAMAELNRLETLRDQEAGKREALAARATAYRRAWRQDPTGASGSAAAGLYDPAKSGDAGSEAAQAPDDPSDDTAKPAAASVDPGKAEVFLDGSSGPVWTHDLRALEAEFNEAAVVADLKAAHARVSAYETRIDRERLRVNMQGAASISAPVNGIIWERLEADGVKIQRGDPILRVVNCDDILVTASVSEVVYNDLETGDAATFRFSGTDEVLPATVARLAGAGAETIYRELAVAPSQRHLERYDVSLIVPGLRKASGEQCPVGRTGRIFFDERPLDIFRRFWN